MRIEIVAPEHAPAGAEFTLRALLVNDAYEPVEIWRNAFVGPTATPQGGPPIPLAVEATFGEDELPLLLQPFTFYGRDRQAGGFPPGIVTISAAYRADGAEPLSASRDVVID
jgi:hypothetical protein